MTRYYNTQRGPLPIPLHSGRSLMAPPKSWIEVDSIDEGSARLIQFVAKGFLVREKIPPVGLDPKEAPQPEVPKAPSAPPPPVVAEVVPVTAPAEPETEKKVELPVPSSRSSDGPRRKKS